MKSSRHSGNSVHCPRSACSRKRLIDSPIESRENHNSSSAFLHSQGPAPHPFGSSHLWDVLPVALLKLLASALYHEQPNLLCEEPSFLRSRGRGSPPPASTG